MRAGSSDSVGRAPLDAVVTHHTDGFRSGVARFNELLAEQLAVPLHNLGGLDRVSVPLLSFKVRELSTSDAAEVEAFAVRSGVEWEVFLHEYVDLPLERRLVERARCVHCGNLEIEDAVRSRARETQTLWTPGLVLDARPFRPSEISVFSFGMAHKIRADMFRRLRKLLDRSGRSYALYVSAANHETASLQDAGIIFDEMHEIFPTTLYFLGNLSDVAVYNELHRATFFAAFFEGGVRSNNTSVAAAMEHGAVVVTNLDEYSPPEYVHGENVIDIERCDALPTDPLTLRRLSVRAMETSLDRDWVALTERLR